MRKLGSEEGLLACVGFNHSTAPWDVLEKVALPKQSLVSALSHLQGHVSPGAAVIISTCNRTETLASGVQPQVLMDWFQTYFEVSHSKTVTLEQFHRCSFSKKGQTVINHLLRMCCGLDSVVLGETQIFGQVKNAYRTSMQNGFTDTVLNLLFEKSFSYAKEIRTTTQIGGNPLSYASISAGIARKIFSCVSEKKMLVVGAGEMIENVIQQFQICRLHNITVTNRSTGRMENLVKKYGGSLGMLDFADLHKKLANFDIVLCCTASREPVISKDTMMRAVHVRQHAPMLMIDMSLPRNISQDVGTLEDVFLYNLEDLSNRALSNQKTGQESIRLAGSLAEKRTQAIAQSLNVRFGADIIRNYRSLLKARREHCTEKALQRLRNGQDTDEVLVRMATELTNQLSHETTAMLSLALQNDDKHVLQLASQIIRSADSMEIQS